MKASLSDVLNNITAHGGYANPEAFPLGSVRLNGKDVPYWQYEGRVVIPDIRENIKNALQEYLREHKDKFFSTASAEGILTSLGDPQVIAVNILDDRVEAVVNMPTVAKDYPVPQPYTVSVPMKLKEMIEFSESFLKDSLKRHFLEYSTLTTMVVSPIDDGVNEIPFFVFLTECGDFYIRTWSDIKPKVEDAIRRTLENIYMPEKVPLHTMNISASPKFSLLRYNGKTYSDLDVKFFLPDDFELDSFTFSFTPEPIVAYAEPIPFIGKCQSKPIYVRYSLSYPAIVTVQDPESRKSLNFATQVYIINNTPPDLSTGQITLQQSLHSELCSASHCIADITVVDTENRPVREALVSFMGCSLGETDSSGKVFAQAPCGIGSLEIYKRGFARYFNLTGSNRLAGMKVVLKRTPVINLHFFEALVTNNTISQTYTIPAYEVYTLNDKHTNEIVYMDFLNVNEGKIYHRIFNKNIARITRIPVGNYIVYITLVDNLKASGGLITPLTITEDMDGGDLYIYLPYGEYFKEIEKSEERVGEMMKLNNLFMLCNLGPVSEKPIDYLNYEGCTRTYDEVISE